jgi:high-affinity iron transporter
LPLSHHSPFLPPNYQAIPLGVLSREFEERTADIIEGVSKVVAAICILILSLKIPKWLGFYKSKKKGKVSDEMDLTLRSIRFNVAWNVWREVAECGVFLLPALLSGDHVGAIPLSAVAGIVIGLAVGFFIYYANLKFKNKLPVAILVTLVLVFLSVGLMVGGVHEFEEVWGETHDVYEIENPNASHKQLPMAIFKVFGYSASRTVLQITMFWCWLALSAALHGFMMWRTRRINRELEEAEKETMHEDDVEKAISDNSSEEPLPKDAENKTSGDENA